MLSQGAARRRGARPSFSAVVQTVNRPNVQGRGDHRRIRQAARGKHTRAEGVRLVARLFSPSMVATSTLSRFLHLLLASEAFDGKTRVFRQETYPPRSASGASRALARLELLRRAARAVEDDLGRLIEIVATGEDRRPRRAVAKHTAAPS